MFHTSNTNRFARGVRFASIAILIGTAWVVGRGFAVMGSGSEMFTSSSIQPPTAENMAVAPLLPMTGRWAFADLDWDIRSHALPVPEAHARLEELASAPESKAMEQFPKISEELLELAATLKIRPTECNGNEIYRLRRPDGEAQLVVRNSKAISLAAVFTQGDGTCKLFELTPRQSTQELHSSEIHLLPLPADARRTGGRYADDGSLLLELVSIESSADQLISTWKAAGWEIRPSGMGDPDQFSFCTTKAAMCNRFNLYYRTEKDNAIHTIRSEHQ